MSDITSKELLNKSVQKVVAFFNNEVTPRLNKKNKVIGVSVAVALTLVYIIRDRVFKPPKDIRHIPYLGYLSVIKSLYKGDSLFDRGYKVNIPLLNSSKLGLYAVGFRFLLWGVMYTIRLMKTRSHRNPEDLDGKSMCRTLRMQRKFF